MKKWLLRIANVLSAFIIAIAVIMLLRAVFTPAGEIPMVGGYGALRVMTGSMEPSIPTNSLIIIHEEDAESLQVGDVITFYSSDPSLGNALNTHRIAAIEQDQDSQQLMFTTKGDANTLEDQYPVTENNVVGKVVLVSGVLGLIVSLLSNPLVFVPCILLPMALLLIYELRNAVKTTVELSRQEEEEALRKTVELLRKKRAAESSANGEASEASEANSSEASDPQDRA